jgi:hypothetical protein
MAGFGITVGDAAITYSFTFQDDGHVYFDSTPDATVPSPIMPELEDLHFIGGAGAATPTALPGIIALVEAVPTATQASIETAVSAHLVTPNAGTPTSQQEDLAPVATMTATQPSPTGHPNRRPNWLVFGLSVTAGVVVGVGIYFISARQKG